LSGESGRRVVHCRKLGQDLDALPKPPFPGPLGQRIFDEISQRAWDLWDEQARTLMNHHGLSMADPEARKFLRTEMQAFLFGGDETAVFADKPPDSP
jgi:Fe-S cluster biosynthesis and repair protein YggX